MKLQLQVALAFLIGLIWIQQGFSDELSAKSGVNNWTCTCSASYQGNQSYIKSNCSTSCDCSPDGGQSGGMWTCTCSSDGLPKVATGIQDTTCFTACNCTSGSLTDVQDTRKHFSSKIVVVILLLCVILTTLAFLASITCYLYRKDKCLIQSPVFLPDRERSCNSATNLISHRASSLSETKIRVDSPINPISGCFRKASFLCRSKTEIIHGTLICFAYSELEHATAKFSHSNLIGLGGSSYVYRGQLKDGTTVAVKRLTAQGGTDADLLFSREVELLAKLHHCHVVPLLGYCSEFQGKFSERLLVFEYMPNGNLRDCLDGIMGENMNWQTRVTIAIGAARGLEYLHEAAAPRILHRDVKSTNILMDELWRAKITDLGMAKRLRADGVPSSSSSPARMQGTFGYFAPEYAMIGRASLMSDVFSFGVVLLEVITGRQPIHKTTNKVEESLVLWATPRLQDSRRVISELPDPRLKGNFPEEELQIMAYLAKECLLMDPDSRPSMSEVVQILSTIAPEKSKRRNIPVSLFQMSSIQRVTTDPYKEKPDSRAEDPVDTEEVLKRDRLSIQQSAFDVDRNLFVGSYIEGADNISTKYMERLIISTSKPHSWGAADDEAVDLTEPRLESFCVENVESA
uniref:non-specific serine/threonine protein kinase n=1 Tax=Populus davidiana TaxID=266767 RepID=A0A6M2FA88_9ROSI